MLRLEKINAGYGRAPILFDIDLEVNEGEAVVLLGRNGAGESTLLKTVIGLVRGSSGRILFNGQPIERWPTHRIARAGIGYVAEERRIFTDLTVAENLEVGRRAAAAEGLSPWTVERLIGVFPNLAELRDRSAGAISGGEQQMLALARTLMGNPRLLLLDEPSEGLAPIIVEQMAVAVGALKRQGLTLLLSEQNWGFAAAIAERAYVLEKGQIRLATSIAALAGDAAARQAYLAL